MKVFLGLVFAACSLLPSVANGQSKTPPSEEILAPYKGTKFLKIISGRSPKSTPVPGLFAYQPTKDDGEYTWYVDTQTQTALTRADVHGFRDGRFSRFNEKQAEKFRATLASRIKFNDNVRWTLGNGKPEGKRDVILVTAYDCGPCSTFYDELKDNAKLLNVNVHFVFSSLGDSDDAETKELLKNIQCAAKPIDAYKAASKNEKVPAAPACDITHDAGAFTASLLGARAFPSVFDRKTGLAIDWQLEGDELVTELNGK
jgi:hypothetical protein